MAKEYTKLARHIQKATSEKALDIANRIAERACNYDSISEKQLEKLYDLTADKIAALQAINPGSFRVS